MSKKIKVGVLGAFRGETMIKFCKNTDECQLVAVCDKQEDLLNKFKKIKTITCYTDFDKFITHDMDAVVLANYANEHVPFAIKSLKAGKHVLSEVLAVASLKEAVDLIEAVESTGLVYAYAENYCYMPAVLEMTKLYQEGKIGELEYAEGEYVHNCESIWADITYGDKNHWRNNMSANFYCTHSVGPMLYVSGLRPVSVTGFELPFVSRSARMGRKSGIAGIEMITLENGAIIKSIHGDLCKNSIWYSFYGTKGRMESAREDSKQGDIYTLYTNYDSCEGVFDGEVIKLTPKDEFADKAEGLGHARSDYYPMHYFIEACKGNKSAKIIDVYAAVDMTLPGIYAYYSVLDGGTPKTIPDLRLKQERDKVRDDDRRPGRDLPTYSKGELDIDDSVYEKLKAEYLAKQK